MVSKPSRRIMHFTNRQLGNDFAKREGDGSAIATPGGGVFDRHIGRRVEEKGTIERLNKNQAEPTMTPDCLKLLLPPFPTLSILSAEDVGHSDKSPIASFFGIFS